MTNQVLAPLRPYQREVARAVIESVRRRQGLSFSVEIARQGGKNEVSARIELVVLARCRRMTVTSIKAAPTFDPQARISLNRLWSLTQRAGLDGIAAREGGNCVRLGRARQLFLSAEPSSNIVGHTADLLLEVDEAQDVDIEKFDKELQPMAASSGATTVFYGTAWDDAGLLERARQVHLSAERRDGVRRHFEYDWTVVAESNPAYGRFVRREEERLGAEHPLFLSQYCLRTLPGAGRLLGPNQLTLLRGAHAAMDAPVAGETYVAGLDVAGEAADAGVVRGSSLGRDATVLTIGRVAPAVDSGGESSVEVVRHYAWTGVSHAALHQTLVALLKQWRISRVVVDATGIGEPVAALLTRALGQSRVEALKLTAESKSRLGYGLLAAVNGGRLRLHGGASGEVTECWRQLERCRATYRPNQTLGFYVDERDGHDDYVISLALVVAAARDAGPRRATGRSGSSEW
jgi:Terminase RNaseH-like domain